MSGNTSGLRQPVRWLLETFLKHFVDMNKQMSERPFCFILGAGSSVSSGIPTGARLVDGWLEDLFERSNSDQSTNPTTRIRLEEWATERNLEIEGFSYDKRVEFYPQVYARRFERDPEEGYAFLEDAMKDARPSLGYSMLAQILESTPHKVVVTTNFDNLVADAVLLYTNTFAQVCGHESLAGFVRIQPRRPLVAKIHRDLLLAPRNDPYETALLHEDWARVLRQLFLRYTPIVIGYGGNDGSLMTFLESLAPNCPPGGIFWCHLFGRPPTNSRILRLLVRHRGTLVPIPGFDKFMFLLGSRLNCKTQEQWIEEEAKRRAENYRRQLRDIVGELDTKPANSAEAAALAQVRLAVTSTVQASGTKESWITWVMRARGTSDPVEREQVYRDAEKALPKSAELLADFAIFMTVVRKNHDEAERLYRKALELDAKNPIIAGNFANFMWEVRKNHDEAERLYRRALELDPSNANNTANLAGFLLAQNRSEEAASLAAKAYALLDNRASVTGASVALYRGLLFRLRSQDDTPALGRLKAAFHAGYLRMPATFEVLLTAVDGKLPDEDRALYHALADAIVDEAKVPTLENFPRWRAVTPIPLTEPWP